MNYRTFQLLLVIVSLAVATVGCSKQAAAPVVVVYASQDQVYAEPILQKFQELSGIEVRAVYDSEAVKTVGLVNRLISERIRPQCDVFWSNEELRARQLAAEGVLDTAQPLLRMGYRSRRLVINTNTLSLEAAPRTLTDLVQPRFKGQVALAYPLFGTTSQHFLALRDTWGMARWEAWCKALVENEALLVDGNSVVVQLVGRGEAKIGLTDSDDIAAGLRNGLPIAALPLMEESLLIPNSIAVVRNAPHPEAAAQLMEFLRDPFVAQELVRLGALEGASRGDVQATTLSPNWDEVLMGLDEATEQLKKIFLR